MIFKTNISKNQNYKPTVYVYQEIYTCKKKTVTSVREATVNNLNMLNENVFPFFSISQNKEENVCETEVTIHRSLVVHRKANRRPRKKSAIQLQSVQQAGTQSWTKIPRIFRPQPVNHTCCTGSLGSITRDVQCTVC